MERHSIWQLEVKTADKKEYRQLFTHRPTDMDEVLETSTVVAVRDMVRHFGIPKNDGPSACRIAGARIGEIQVIELALFENGDSSDND